MKIVWDKDLFCYGNDRKADFNLKIVLDYFRYDLLLQIGFNSWLS